MKTARVMCSGGIGVMLGLAVANVIGLALIGMVIVCLVGGVAGIGILCWPEICQQSLYVWEKVCGWKPDWEMMKLRTRFAGAFGMFFFSIGVHFLLLSVVAFTSVDLLARGKITWLYTFGLKITWLPIAITYFGFLIGLVITIFNFRSTIVQKYVDGCEKILTPKEQVLGDLAECESIFLHPRWNIFCAPFFAIVYAIVAIHLLLGMVKNHWRIPLKFAFEMYKRIHSDAVVCLFVDICIGVSVCWFLGWHTPLQYVYAGVLGAFFAGINYRLVAVCWLKVQPVKA